MDALVLIGSFAILAAIGVPLAFSLGLSALIGALWIDLPAEAIMLKISDGTDDFSLLAIPFFVLAGAIMAEGGMAFRLINLAKVLVGWIRGGLAIVNIFASTLFGTISGSSVADAASVGSIMIPQMVRMGYPRVFAVNLTICGSVQAVLIPPSHNAVIYSIAAGGSVSIAHLFLAGILPGVLFGLCLVGLVLWTARRQDMPKAESVTFGESLKIAADSVWGLGTVFIILGGILSGVFTATESAAVACVYAFVITMFVYRDYKWKDLPRLVHRTVKTVAMVMLLIGVSAAFGYMMALMQIPAKATALFLEITNNKYVMLMLVNILLAAARDVHGHGADAADLHADPAAGGQGVRCRSRAFRDDHDRQSGDRADHATGRADVVRGLRDRQRDDRGGQQGAMAVLRGHVRGAAHHHLRAVVVAVDTEHVQAIARRRRSTFTLQCRRCAPRSTRLKGSCQTNRALHS